MSRSTVWTLLADELLREPEWEQLKLDVDRCVDLHNEIVRLGWEGSGRDYQDFVPTHWKDDSEEARKTLNPDLMSFLQRADYSPEHSFHFWASGLFNLENMFFWDSLFQHKIEEEKRFVNLYHATSIWSHQVGIVYDQVTNAAIMCTYIDDIGWITNGRIGWYPLESILEAWLDMIKSGKVKAIRENEDSELMTFPPWALVPYTEQDLQETLDAFDNLIEAIQDRMPGALPDQSTVQHGLVDEHDLDEANILDGFARKFLLRARRPHFEYIAPGLKTINSEKFARSEFMQVFRKHDYVYHDEDIDVPPIPVFISDVDCKDPVPQTKFHDRNFQYPYNLVERYSAGLYLEAVSFSLSRWDDQTIFVLPYGIGSRRHARKSDGSLYGENPHDDTPIAKDTTADLYQAGHRPFGDRHGPQLVQILQHWLMMVENGHWMVGAEGVEGGIDEWKKADRRGTWELYVLPQSV
ncbi:unnamed protein product [Periconia digitata]|uniref:Uncharacterized protein n=1 Tax=Periconia digitata TaxID=1303443 RepID=A0A9W4U2V8_9PLEO|nr:unnamed protein product [Periconia digitata]